MLSSFPESSGMLAKKKAPGLPGLSRRRPIYYGRHSAGTYFSVPEVVVQVQLIGAELFD